MIKNKKDKFFQQGVINLRHLLTAERKRHKELVVELQKLESLMQKISQQQSESKIANIKKMIKKL